MYSKKCYQKRLMLRDTNEKDFDVSRFAIFLSQSDTTVTSTENGRRKIIKVTAVQRRRSTRLFRYSSK